MKALLFWLALGSTLGLVQCKHEAAAPADGAVQLRATESKAVRASDKTVELTLLNISDSRCPANTDCIWQGQANATVEVRGSLGGRQAATLCLGACKNDSAAVEVDAVPYWVHLESVEPYPSVANQAEPKTATFRLTRR
ncbi:hypothetical protein GCM10027346_22030 [Hymenobacter seoulensis]